MTIRLPAWLQAGSYTAELDRQVGSGLLTPGSALGSRGGVRRWGGNELQVLQTTTASMQVTVKAGMAWIQGGYSSVQGAYAVMNDADVNLTIGAAHATLSRIDLVVLEVLDATYSGASNVAQLRVVPGTAASSPVAPAVTGSYIILAQVRVNPAVSSIITSAITDVRPYVAAVGGVLPVKNATERVNLTQLHVGAEVLELDTGRVYQWGFGSGGGWLYAYGGTPPADWITPTLINGWTLYPGSGTVWRGPRYRKTQTGQVEMQGIIQAGQTSMPMFVVPAGYRPSVRLIFVVACGTNVDTTARVDVDSAGNVWHVSSPLGIVWLSTTFTYTADQ